MRTRHWSVFGMVAGIVMLPGCMVGMHGALQESTVAGRVPCMKREVSINLDEFENGSTGWLWVAGCRGVRYSCARTFTGTAFTGGVSSQTSCTPLDAPRRTDLGTPPDAPPRTDVETPPARVRSSTISRAPLKP